jgi:signal transduction histidine kinase
LTSVRSLSELLVDYPGLDDVDRIRFLNIIREETERLMRLLVHLKPPSDIADF